MGPGAASGLRCASSGRSSMAMKPSHLMVFEPYAPVTSYVWPFSKKGLAYYKYRGLKWLRFTLARYNRWRSPEGVWRTQADADEIQGLYVRMNQAYARGDATALSQVLMPSMLKRMVPEMRQTLGMGAVSWKFHGAAQKPRTVHLVGAQIQESDGITTYLQAIVRVSIKQSMAIYGIAGPGRPASQVGKLLAGNPEEVTTISEYVVAQKVMGRHEPWKLCAKIAGPTWPPRDE
ncbi:hypothetical protein CXG81DRAFT_11618 [Caulochytrium protostelioides]|uniref:Large ribosomal subunit protein mL45 n=1 Tax=Caulochytrium protostelioides TaxID=1555241 RepID=A0A4P9X903_9FUNG|nr:hypothetical protein CXG81DRAFT_11618 [Caulochytrium protostelioides]|eukprot:RKP01758.1 hypothetical protein CXG81DRAFT_11618 [Caulochytrium protostelioides]